MTGKELYDTLIWAWEQHLRPRQSSYYWEQPKREDGFLQSAPPAWPFLSERERGAFSQAAKHLTPESNTGKEPNDA